MKTAMNSPLLKRNKPKYAVSNQFWKAALVAVFPVKQQKKQVFNVTRIGFKPMTYSLEGCRSIQLSYRAFYFFESAKDKSLKN